MKLTELKKPRSARVEYKGWGCFNRDDYIAVFDGEDPIHPLVSSRDKPDIEVRADASLGDLEDLDRLFEFWRQTRDERGSAGTSDCEVRVNWLSDGEEVDTEVFEHAYPPPDLEQAYYKIFLRILMGTVRARVLEIAEAKREAFLEWAVDNHPLTEIRYLEESTLCALLRSDRAPGLDARELARSLSKACAEQTDAIQITCLVYDGKDRLARHTFKTRPRSRAYRIGDLFGFAVFVVVVMVVGVIWSLLWPFNRLYRWIVMSK